MPHRLAQQRMTLSELEWPFHASRTISAVAELFVLTAVNELKNMLGHLQLQSHQLLIHK